MRLRSPGVCSIALSLSTTVSRTHSRNLKSTTVNSPEDSRGDWRAPTAAPSPLSMDGGSTSFSDPGIAGERPLVATQGVPLGFRQPRSRSSLQNIRARLCETIGFWAPANPRTKAGTDQASTLCQERLENVETGQTHSSNAAAAAQLRHKKRQQKRPPKTTPVQNNTESQNASMAGSPASSVLSTVLAGPNHACSRPATRSDAP